MSLTITVVTTANRQRRFVQNDPKEIQNILGSLTYANQLFHKPMLIIVSDQSTEIYNPATITRIELETSLDLSPFIPSGWLKDPCLHASSEAASADDNTENEDRAKQFEFFFVGGDALKTRLESAEKSDMMTRNRRIASLFEQPVIPYRLSGSGIGLMNPANLTRTKASAPLQHPPAGTWHGLEIAD